MVGALLTCFYLYSYRLADHPELSAEFTKHLKKLPPGLKTTQDRALYRRLIDTYGTHYIHQVTQTTTFNIICCKESSTFLMPPS